MRRRGRNAQPTCNNCLCHHLMVYLASKGDVKVTGIISSILFAIFILGGAMLALLNA